MAALGQSCSQASREVISTANVDDGDTIRPAGSSVHSLCSVCHKQFQKYTCPRCRVRYCGLHCYKNHSTMCTEVFYRTNAVDDLKNTRASKKERQGMQEILERLFRLEIEGRDDEDSDSDTLGHQEDAPPQLGERAGVAQGGHAEFEASSIAGLSQQTLRTLLEEGGDADLSAISSDDAAILRDLLAKSDLASLVKPWQPWWLHPDARAISLASDGTRVVSTLAADASPTDDALPSRSNHSDDTQSMHSSDEEDVASIVPSPPSSPLPPVATLSTAPPSPLLLFQALELLFAYCLCMRTYNGEPSADWGQYVTSVWHLAPSLFEPPTTAPLPESISEALEHAVQRACQPPVGDGRCLATAQGVVRDVHAMLTGGRGVLLCALCDLQRQITAALEHMPPSNQAHAPQAANTGCKEDAASAAGTGRTGECGAKPGRGGERGAKTRAPARASVLTSVETACSGTRRVRARQGAAQPRNRQRPSLRGAQAFVKGCQAAARKLAFLQSWANELRAEELAALGDAVEAEIAVRLQHRFA